MSKRAISADLFRQLLFLFLLTFFSSSGIFAQTNVDALAADKETIQLLLRRIDQLEARVSQLEREQPKLDGTAKSVSPGLVNLSAGEGADPPHASAATVRPAAGAASAISAAGSRAPSAATPQAHTSSSQEADQAQSENAMAERMDLSKTLLRIRGFGDVAFHGDTSPGDTTSFSLGQLDLFITSDMSDRFRFLSELVFEAGPDNIYGAQVGGENSFKVDIERYLLQYSHNDYFNLAVGRGHTSIGYYNTAYHHSTWLQTTTERPFLFHFEDDGGILPIHIVGATASGLVPSGALGLHYVAEVGNGRESRSPLSAEPVQNDISDQNGKAFNIALFARPEAIRGFQSGFSVYRDKLAPANSPAIGETILAAHAVLIRPKYEWLNEALLDRHAVIGTASIFNTPAFYSQISKQFGSYRPYFRYEYLNVAKNEPVFPDVALRHGPLGGVRYDPHESVALKLEYQYTFLRDKPGVHGLTAQVGFTF
jgi:hypothetical protein